MATLDVVTEASVRDYLQVTDTTGQWSNGIIGSNILTASSRLQRVTGRQWEPQTAATKTFSTEGRDAMAIPDLRSTTSITLNDADLTIDESIYLLPSRSEQDIFIGVQFARRRRGAIYSDPAWWDRNLDRYGPVSAPNDLSITGDWGRLESSWPIEVIQAIRALAGFLTLRPDALLSGAVNRLDQGVVYDMSQWPLEVQSFIREWKNIDPVVSV